MPKVVVTDTSCLIALNNIQKLELLKDVYGTVITSQNVADEYGESLPNWIVVNNPSDKQKQQILEMQIDKGEASAINLALEISADLIILDDLKARKVAQQLKLKYTGTLGLIIKAKQLGKIKTVKPLLEKLQSSNFRISDELLETALNLAGEN